jgi:hypothetical protein
VFGHSANNADKYIKYNKLSDGNWQFNKLTICLYVPTPRDKALSLHVMCINQLCLYLMLCLCKQIYIRHMYTPRTELVHQTCRQWSSFSIVRIQNKSLHRKIYAIYFWCIVFQIVFHVFQTFVCPPKEILILDLEISEFKIFVLLLILNAC